MSKYRVRSFFLLNGAHYPGAEVELSEAEAAEFRASIVPIEKDEGRRTKDEAKPPAVKDEGRGAERDEGQRTKDEPSPEPRPAFLLDKFKTKGQKGKQ